MGGTVKFTATVIPGAFIVEPIKAVDMRGEFVKVYNKDAFLAAGIDVSFQECFYSISARGVIRGMHFQTPPLHCAKLVYVTAGKVEDVVLDLRKGSPSYSKHISVEISEENRLAMYIPAGCAHGFQSLSDASCVAYLQSSVYSAEHDEGISYDSFGKNWPMDPPLLSERDLGFPAFGRNETPFVFG